MPTEVPRDVLPPAERAFEGKVGTCYSDSVAHVPVLPSAPDGAPNVLVVLLDDVGFGHASTFGAGQHTPPPQRLAGPAYNLSHTTAPARRRSNAAPTANLSPQKRPSAIFRPPAPPDNNDADSQWRKNRSPDPRTMARPPPPHSPLAPPPPARAPTTHSMFCSLPARQMARAPRHDAPLIKSGWLLGVGHLLQAGDSLGHRRVRREQLPHHVAGPERVGDHQM